MMKKIFFSLAKNIYRKTPFKTLRKLYYQVFQYLVRDKIVRKNINGSIYELDLGEKIDIALYLEEFEKDLVQSIKGFCKPGMTIFDVGANFGAHALLFSHLVEESGHVYAFEPTEYAFKKLKINKNLNKSKNININNLALSESNSTKENINFRSSWCTNGGRKDYPCTVRFKPLDEWVEEENINKLDLIKLDVDGNEYSVLIGAQQVLSKFSPMIFLEVWGPNFKDEARNPFSLLQSFGYKFYSLDLKEQYQSIDDLQRLVRSKDGILLDFSVNIIAKI